MPLTDLIYKKIRVDFSDSLFAGILFIEMDIWSFFIWNFLQILSCFYSVISSCQIRSMEYQSFLPTGYRVGGAGYSAV